MSHLASALEVQIERVPKSLFIVSGIQFQYNHFSKKDTRGTSSLKLYTSLDEFKTDG